MAPRGDAGGTADRQRCAYCGANNFPTSPTCWQCGRPLRPLSAAAMPTQSPAAPPPAGSAPAAWAPAINPSALPPVNPGLAPKAAAALGLLFPWAALPIGITFLMLDDPRKAKLGWIAIAWSIGGTILNIITFLWPLIALLPYLKALVPHPGGTAPDSGGAGIPSLGGDMILAFRLLALFLF